MCMTEPSPRSNIPVDINDCPHSVQTAGIGVPIGVAHSPGSEARLTLEHAPALSQEVRTKGTVCQSIPAAPTPNPPGRLVPVDHRHPAHAARADQASDDGASQLTGIEGDRRLRRRSRGGEGRSCERLRGFRQVRRCTMHCQSTHRRQ
jgi:hypothetical protein